MFTLQIQKYNIVEKPYKLNPLLREHVYCIYKNSDSLFLCIFIAYFGPLPSSEEYEVPSANGLTKNIYSKETEKYLPNRPPYSEIINDPNLNVNDKISVLEILDPENGSKNGKTPLDRVSSEVGNTFILRDISSNDRFPLNNVVHNVKNQQPQRRTLQKRSYLFYDDLSMHDTYDYDETPISGFLESPYNRQMVDQRESSCKDDDIAACNTCGGKPHKKKPEKGCKGPLCSCNERKAAIANGIVSLKTHRNRIRSVSDAW